MSDQLPQEWLDRIDYDHENFQVMAGIIERLLESTHDPDEGYKKLLRKLFSMNGAPYHD